MLAYVLYKEPRPEMVANWSESPVIKSLGKCPFKSPLCIKSWLHAVGVVGSAVREGGVQINGLFHQQREN